jgi:hypothetical protein
MIFCILSMALGRTGNLPLQNSTKAQKVPKCARIPTVRCTLCWAVSTFCNYIRAEPLHFVCINLQAGKCFQMN